MNKVKYISSGVALIAFASIATALRFAQLPIGIGELIVVLLFFLALRDGNTLQYVRHPIILFWLGFITVAGIGALLSPVAGAGSVHTGIAYVYTTCFSLMALAFLDKQPKDHFPHIIRAIVVVPAIFLLVPLLCFLTLSFNFAESIGINTAFPSRIAAWSTNPNQLALFILPLPIWLLAIHRDSQWSGVRWLQKFFFLWVFFLLGLCIRSDALFLAWIIGLPLLTVITAFCAQRLNWKVFLTTIAAFLLAFVTFKVFIESSERGILFNWNIPVLAKLDAAQAKSDSAHGKSDAEKAKLDAEKAKLDAEKAKLDAEKAKLDAAQAKSDSAFGVGFDQNKTGVRRTLWMHAVEAWQQSPIVGNGPGAFSYLQDPNIKEEAHNLGFDLLTQVGVVGVLLFAWLYLWLLYGAWQARDPYSLLILLMLMIFSGAHFMLRQPVFSLYLIICAIAVKHGSFVQPKKTKNIQLDK